MSKREYGTGSVYYDKSKDKWFAVLRIGVDADGKVKKKKVSANTKREAKEKIKELQRKLLLGDFSEPSKLTIVQIATTLNENKHNTNIINDNTYITNLRTISLIAKNNQLNTVPLQNVNELMLVSFFASITDYSNSSIKKVYDCINQVYKKAVKLKIVSDNLMDDIQKPKSKKPTRIVKALTIEQQRKLIDALNADAKEPYRTMLLLQMLTGARSGEVAALPYVMSKYIRQWKMLKIERTVTRDTNSKAVIGDTTKTYAGVRQLRLDDYTVEVLCNYIDNYFVPNKYNLLFVNRDGEIVVTSSLNDYYKRLIQRYDVAPPENCSQHQLRHTYATRCIESGMPAKVLQKRLGHSDISITMNTYCDVFEDYEEQYVNSAAEYLKDKELFAV